MINIQCTLTIPTSEDALTLLKHLVPILYTLGSHDKQYWHLRYNQYLLLPWQLPLTLVELLKRLWDSLSSTMLGWAASGSSIGWTTTLSSLLRWYGWNGTGNEMSLPGGRAPHKHTHLPSCSVQSTQV